MNIHKHSKVLGKVTIFALIIALTACGGGGGGDTGGPTPPGGTGGPGGGTGGTAGAATLSWTPPTTRLDGSSLGPISAYRVYYGTSSGNYSSTVTLNTPGLTEYVIENLPSDTYYFVITVVDASGAESPYSTEVTKTL